MSIFGHSPQLRVNTISMPAPLRKIRLLCFVLAGLNVLIALQLAILLWFIAPGAGRSVNSLASVLKKAIPAVVTLRITGRRMVPTEIKPPSANDEPRHVGAPVIEEFRTGGSGVIIDAKLGYVITNNHVIENATNIDVGLSDGRHASARIIGRDIGTDLALLKVDAMELPSLVIGNSDAAHVGDVVVAVGNPFGLEGTATMGIISAVMRTEIGHEAFEDYLQIDAQINRGNSGGALVNVNGELIGINTVIAGGRGQGLNIGFAIPINMAMKIQSEIIKHGRMRRGSAGLIVKDLRHDASSNAAGINYGAVVEWVAPKSPAYFQGIKTGDIILQAASKPVRSAADYMTRVSMIPVGEKLSLLIYSEGKTRRLSLNVAAVTLDPERKQLHQNLGSISELIVGEILPGNPLYGGVRGAQILEFPPASPSNSVGLELGDVIVGIDGNKVMSAGDLVRRVGQAGLQYRMDIVRNERPLWVRMSR